MAGTLSSGERAIARASAIPLETLACKPVSVACEPSLWPRLPRGPGSGFRAPETEGRKLALSSPSSLQRLEAGLFAPAKLRVFGERQEISFSAGVRGGPARTRTSIQSVISFLRRPSQLREAADLLATLGTEYEAAETTGAPAIARNLGTAGASPGVSQGVDLRSTRFSQGPGGHRKKSKVARRSAAAAVWLC